MRKIIFLIIKFISPILRVFFNLDNKNFRRLIYYLNTSNEFLLSCSVNEKFIVLSSNCHLSKDLFINNYPTDFKKIEKVNVLLKARGIYIDHLVDVGANIGSICIPACNRKIVKSATAIEPDPKNFRLLKTNVTLNLLENKINVINSAIGADPSSELKLGLSNYNSADNRIVVEKSNGEDLPKNVIKVKSTNLDFLIDKKLDDGLLLWMDIQGYEGYALKGSTRILKSKKPLVLEFSPSLMIFCNSYQLFKDSLLSNDYKIFYNLDDKNGKPHNLNDFELDKLFKMYEKNERFTDILVI